MSNSKYKMSISLNVLNHMGLNLYSNTPAVLAEVIANAWDADATEVKVDFNMEENIISVSDNGCGMNLEDVNEKFLHVGYQKRKDRTSGLSTPRGRKPMGRKGIGKLSLFSIANKISVYTLKKGMHGEAFLMDAQKIKEAIKTEDPSQIRPYEPQELEFNTDIVEHGTLLVISELKKLRLTRSSLIALKRRIARRFGIIPNANDFFKIYVNDEEVTFSDRDYFHKARFVFQYGDYDYAQHCRNLDIDDSTGDKIQFHRECSLIDENNGERYNVEGWIAIARRSNDLDDAEQNAQESDNLNKITIVVRGKVAQEDILQEIRLGGMITKYIYGEIHADFLDDDEKDDIATSSRQRISEDDSRYRSLKSFVESELKYIWTKTNKLKEKKSLEMALSSNPYVKEWYRKLRPKQLQKTAIKMFTLIDQAGIDESEKSAFYANGVLACERVKMNSAIEDLLDVIDASNLDSFLEYLADVDAIEAASYREIVYERLSIIEKLQSDLDENVLEKILQEYIFDHLFLLDPAWERATEYKHMEERIQRIVSCKDQIDKSKNKEVRVDIRYRRVAGAHVIIELKRGSVKVSKLDIESQLKKYIRAVENELQKDFKEIKYPIESICIVGKLPHGWENLDTRKRDEESLRPFDIKVITYDELINNAHSAYSKFLKISGETEDLSLLIERIRNHKSTSTNVS